MITTKRGVLGSRPIFKGTRITVQAVARFINAGFSDDIILKEYPDLHSNQIKLTRKLLKELSV